MDSGEAKLNTNRETGEQPVETLDVAKADRLLRRQDELQSEARHMLEDLQLIPTLSQAGRVLHVGSSVYGLMAGRDIDLYVIRDEWNPKLCWQALSPIFERPRMQSIRLSKWTGRHRSHELPDGYSAVLRYYSDNGDQWRTDIWFFSPNVPALELELDAELRRNVPGDARLAILWIKDAYRNLPSYRSFDVYDAVLHHGVRTPAQLDSYLQSRKR